METLSFDENLAPNVMKEEAYNPNNPSAGSILSATAERRNRCKLQGLQIAQHVLKQHTPVFNSLPETIKKGGIWNYTIGLVGKPSAGKSTFFNAATAFARQRDDRENVLGGATMVPHPFTTIDPNIGDVRRLISAFLWCSIPHGIGFEKNRSASSQVVH